MALCASTASQHQKSDSDDYEQPGSVCYDTFIDILRQMKKSAGGPDSSLGSTHELDVDEHGLTPLCQAVMFLMQQVIQPTCIQSYSNLQ